MTNAAPASAAPAGANDETPGLQPRAQRFFTKSARSGLTQRKERSLEAWPIAWMVGDPLSDMEDGGRLRSIGLALCDGGKGASRRAISISRASSALVCRTLTARRQRSNASRSIPPGSGSSETLMSYSSNADRVGARLKPAIPNEIAPVVG